MSKARRFHRQHPPVLNLQQACDQAFRVWYGVCNATGGQCLTAAVACAPLHASWLWAQLCFAGLTLAHVYQSDKLPMDLVRLRKAAKADPIAQQELRQMLRHYLGLRSLLRDNALFLLGYVMLMAVALRPLIAHGYPFTAPFLDHVLG